MSTARFSVRVGYDTIEDKETKDPEVREIFLKDTGRDEYPSNRALPPAFFYFGLELTKHAVDELKAINGVWVKYDYEE